MKNLKKIFMISAILMIVLNFNVTAQKMDNETKQKYPLKEDISTIDGIMKASYEIVSGEAGQKRDWERDNSLHHPNAGYFFFSKNLLINVSLEEFHKLTDDLVKTSGFYESEINREVRIFGNMANVWSTYETRLEKNGAVVRRGINNVQLLREKDRWFIVSWIFEGERKDNPIPTVFDKHF